MAVVDEHFLMLSAVDNETHVIRVDIRNGRASKVGLLPGGYDQAIAATRMGQVIVGGQSGVLELEMDEANAGILGQRTIFFGPVWQIEAADLDVWVLGPEGLYNARSVGSPFREVLPGSAKVERICTVHARPNHIVATLVPGGIAYSTDRGESWELYAGRWPPTK